MELREWQYINKPAAGSSTTSTASTSSSFKKRFDKIINYYDRHLPAEVDYLMVNILTNDTLDFTENFSDGDKARFNISINPATEAWTLKYYVNGSLVDSLSDTGWTKLLKTLYVGYIDELPHAGTPEYKNLLTEWVAMNNKASSSTGYKKRFEKLIKYHIDHASSELESITKKDIKDYSFRLGEHYNDGKDEFDRAIIVAYDSSSDTFFAHIFVDTEEVQSQQVESYDKLVRFLEPYMYLPDGGTPEYDELLTESGWVVMKNNSSTSSTTAPVSNTSFESYKNRFKKLFNYATKHRHLSVDQTEIEKLSEDEHTSMFHFTHHVLGGVQGFDYDLEIILSINKPQGNWYLLVYEGGKGQSYDKIADLQGPDYETLLKALSDYIEVPAVGSAEYKDLLQESINTSIADDFKLYENLWENI